VRVVVLALLVACTPIELLTTPDKPIACLEDKDCGPNALCVGEACTACPSLDACTSPDPLGLLAKLERNGCTVCEFAPTTECNGPSDCSDTCYKGARCAAGCVRLECCANVCEPAGCVAPAPVGCKAVCEASMGCDVCVTTACRCDAGQWVCEAGCVAALTTDCLYAP